MTYRDARGKFRRPTDAERWPDPVTREYMQATRVNVARALHEWEDQQVRDRRDYMFYAGDQWSSSVQ